MTKQRKNKRINHPLKHYSWLLVPIIALGGLFLPLLGLLLLPIMGFLVISGFRGGKYWCGNLCPHGSLFDKIYFPYFKDNKFPNLIKNVWTTRIFFIFFMLMFGLRVQRILLAWGSMEFWDRLGTIMVFNYLMPTIIGTALALTINTRAWCNFCPMGTIEALSFRLGRFLKLNYASNRLIKISDEQKCLTCGKCQQKCPMQLSPYQNFDQNNSFTDLKCIKCKTCVRVCPPKILDLEKEVS